LDAAGEAIAVVNEVAENVAGFNTVYDGTADYDEVIKLVYDDDSEVYAPGAINGQFLGVSAADSGNADQPRAIIGQWSIAANRWTEVTTPGDGTSTTALTRRQVDGQDVLGSVLTDGVYGADLVVP
jgi:hypothetical protein